MLAVGERKKDSAVTDAATDSLRHDQFLIRHVSSGALTSVCFGSVGQLRYTSLYSNCIIFRNVDVEKNVVFLS